MGEAPAENKEFWWEAAKSVPIKIKISLRNMRGVISLGVASPASEAGKLHALPLPPDTDPHGDVATYEITSDVEGLSFELKVKGGVTVNPPADIYLSLEQNGNILKCIDGEDKVQNKQGSKYKAIKIGTISPGDVKVLNFGVIL